MSQEKRFSDEFLNAFVDNQIAAEEKSRAYVEIQRDEALNRQVCELRKLHDLVQLAYREPPAPPAHAASGPNSGRARLRFGYASFLLALGTFWAPDPYTESAATRPSHA
jgi:anti-sigma factor RsiW